MPWIPWIQRSSNSHHEVTNNPQHVWVLHRATKAAQDSYHQYWQCLQDGPQICARDADINHNTQLSTQQARSDSPF
jgi:hypothetical protein